MNLGYFQAHLELGNFLVLLIDFLLLIRDSFCELVQLLVEGEEFLVEFGELLGLLREFEL